MRIWFDTEFQDRGGSLDFISIGLVRDDGATYYAENSAIEPGSLSLWLRENVVPKLTGERKDRAEIAADLRAFCRDDPEFWAYFASHDWVVLCSIFGGMMQLPTHWPMYCNDLMWITQGRYRLPKQETPEHNALNDALWLRDAWHYARDRA